MKKEQVRARPYRMDARQARVDDSRRRIIEVALEMFSEEGFHAVGLEEVARRAGVSRKTIYYQFDSKLGLLQALVADLNERGSVSEFVGAALSETDIRLAVRRFVQGSCSFWEREHAVIRALATLAASDADARLVVDRVNASRRRDLGGLTDRARGASGLRAGWSATRAADSLWLFTCFESYDLLRRTGKSAADATKLLCDLALSLLDP